jgi:hypothetical protein
MPESDTLEPDNFAPEFSIDDAFDVDDMLPLSDSFSDGETETSAEAGSGFWSWRTASRTDTATRESGGAAWLGQFFKNYGQTWVWYAFTALFFGLVCNGIFGIPLYQVVDVNLALFLTWVAVMGALLVLILVLEVVNGEFRDALVTLLLLAAYMFLPFGAITGYMVYAWFGGGEVSNASFVYEGFMAIFVRGYAFLNTQVGDIIGAVEIKDTAQGAVSTINSDVVLRWTQIVAGVIAAVDIIWRWITRAASA